MTYALNSEGTAIAFPLRSVTGADAVAVRCRVRLLTLRGEWPSDVDQGTPMLEWVAGVPASDVESWYRSQLRQVDGVASVVSLTATRSGEAVAVNAQLAVQTLDGLVTLTIGEPLPYDTRGAPAWYTVSGALIGRGAWHRA